MVASPSRANSEIQIEGFDDIAEPLCNIEAEEAVLGALLLDPEAIYRIEGEFDPDAFYDRAHRHIARAMLAIREDDQVTDVVTVASCLMERGQLKLCGGTARLQGLVEKLPTSANVDQHLELVLQKYKLRRLQANLVQAVHLTATPGLSVENVCEGAERLVFEATQFQKKQGLTPAADVLMSRFQDIEQRSQAGSVLPGIATGFYDLDAMTQGYQRSDFIVYGARPAMGKTSMLLAQAAFIAATTQMPVTIYSLEMSKEQIINRLLSLETGIDLPRIVSGRIAQHEWEPLGHAISKLAALPILINDEPYQTVSSIRSDLRQLSMQHGGNIGPVFIDYLQLFNGGNDDTEGRTQELSKITRGLKNLARELHIPVICLSQLSRGVESRTNKRPMMSDLRESGSIEQDSDMIVMLYRDEYYNPETPDRGLAEVIIVKQRNGPIGTVKLLFEPRFARFRNLQNPC